MPKIDPLEFDQPWISRLFAILGWSAIVVGIVGFGALALGFDNGHAYSEIEVMCGGLLAIAAAKIIALLSQISNILRVAYLHQVAITPRGASAAETISELRVMSARA